MARWNRTSGLRSDRARRIADNHKNESGNERLQDGLHFVSTTFRKCLPPQVALTKSYRQASHNRSPTPRKRRRYVLRNRPDTCRGVGPLLSHKRPLDRVVRRAHDTIVQRELCSKFPPCCNKCSAR